MARRPLQVGISGSYGGLNIGDEAILHGILSQLRDGPPVAVTVFTRNAEDTLRRHDVERAVEARTLSRREAEEAVRKLDLLILGGGGILYDKDAEMYLREVNLAADNRVPIMVYAISAGPLEKPDVKRSVARALNRTELITVRDRAAKQLLEDVGVTKEIAVTADPALLIRPEPVAGEALGREGFTETRRRIGFSVREPGPAAPDIDVEHYHALLANSADFMIERYDADIVFVPMERARKDVQQSHAVIARMQTPQRATVLKGDYTPGQLLSIIGSFEFAVGMRLHFLLFAALQSIPFVALPYASKVEGFMTELGLRMPPLSQVTTGHLIAYLDRSWDERAKLASHIRAALPKLKEQAERNGAIAAALLEGLGADKTAAGNKAVSNADPRKT